MTDMTFLIFYPQFEPFALGVVLPSYVAQANARFGDLGEDAEEARFLFVAHKLTLYAVTCLPPGTPATKGMLAEAGSSRRQRVSAKKAGEVSVSYTETSMASSDSAEMAEFRETVFGLQLLSLLQLHSSAEYIP